MADNEYLADPCPKGNEPFAVCATVRLFIMAHILEHLRQS